MVLWRISRHHDLSGTGGQKAAGRWHDAGHAIVYLAETPSAALLEVCVHTSANDIPEDFTLLRIEGPRLSIPEMRRDALPSDWQQRLDVTREMGMAWLKRGKSVLLRVPSAIVPETTNLLFNPLHERAADFRITKEFFYPFDARLKG